MFYMIAVLNDFFYWKSLEANGLDSEKHLIFPELLPSTEKYFDLYYGHQVSYFYLSGNPL